eukprot:1930558-Pleurochrysis_carterae.AAC.1
MKTHTYSQVPKRAHRPNAQAKHATHLQAQHGKYVLKQSAHEMMNVNFWVCRHHARDFGVRRETGVRAHMHSHLYMLVGPILPSRSRARVRAKGSACCARACVRAHVRACLCAWVRVVCVRERMCARVRAARAHQTTAEAPRTSASYE